MPNASNNIKKYYDEIKKNAEINYRSINGEIIFRLRQSMKPKKINPKLLISKIEALQATIKAPALNDEILHEAKNTGRL